jgi:hypothetical protein
MKQIAVVCLLLSLSGATWAIAREKHAPDDDAFKGFWHKFKTAVMSVDHAAVAGLSKFPIRMSYGIKSIKNGKELRRRYREVFHQQSDAAKCFAKKEPEVEAQNPKRVEVACPNDAGDEVVVYAFERTGMSWRFVSLDNINE